MYYFKKLLISDLIILYKKTNELKYLEDLKRRFKFCGFKENEIEEFVNFETLLYEFKEYKYDKSIIDNHYIIGKENSKEIFPNTNLYKFIPDSTSKEMLYTSEIVSILDEAAVLCYSNKIKNYRAKNEIVGLSKEEFSNWLYKEFYNRLEYLCRCGNKINTNTKKSIFKDKILNLFWNETKICIDARWDTKYVTTKKFEPYSEEFYD